MRHKLGQNRNEFVRVDGGQDGEHVGYDVRVASVVQPQREHSEHGHVVGIRQPDTHDVIPKMQNIL